MSCERKVKVVLHGYLKDLYKDDIVLSGSTVAEIINGMCKQTKAFNPLPGMDRHCITVKDFRTEESLTQPIPANTNEIHIYPQLSGGKGGGFFKVIIGVVIVGVALAVGGVGIGALFAGQGGFAAQLFFKIGTSLILGGLLEVVSPAPKIDRAGVANSKSDPEASKYLGATQNTVRVGTRIPLLYGEHEAFGHYISFDVDAKDIAV